MKKFSVSIRYRYSDNIIYVIDKEVFACNCADALRNAITGLPIDTLMFSTMVKSV